MSLIAFALRVIFVIALVTLSIIIYHKINGDDDRYVFLSSGSACSSSYAIAAEVIAGSSMLPSIKDGDVIEVIPYDPSVRLVSGDIVKVNSTWLGVYAHRVVGAYDGYVITKGDNNKGTEKANYTDILGVVCGVKYK